MSLSPDVASAPIVVVGELHGTNEAPAAAGNVAEAVLATGQPIALALELPSDTAAALEAYLDSDGSAEARAALLASRHWTVSRRFQDGRGSIAIAGLIERMRTLRADGKPIRIIPFVPTNYRHESYESDLAKGILSQRRPGERIVVLVGNVHAMKYGAEASSPAPNKMASFLPADTVALAALWRAGQSWTCSPECRVYEERGHYSDPSFDGRIEMKRVRGCDGAIYIGSITASPPAAAAD